MAAIQARSKPQAKLFVGTAKDEAGNKMPKDWQSQTLADVSTEKVEALAQDLNQRPFKSTELWKPQNAYALNALSLQAYLDGDIEQDQLITTSIVTEMFKQFFNGYQEFEKISADNPALGGVAKDPVEIPSIIDFLSPRSQEMDAYRSPSIGSPRDPLRDFPSAVIAGLPMEHDFAFSPSVRSPRSPRSPSYSMQSATSGSSDRLFEAYLGEFVHRFVERSYQIGDQVGVYSIDKDKKTKKEQEIYKNLQAYLSDSSVRASEKFIFRCTVPVTKVGSTEKFHDMSNIPPILERMHDIFPFMMLEKKLGAMCVTVASFGLMKAIVDIANPGRVILEVPAYGKLSTRNIRNLFERGRVPINLNVHPSIKLPKLADTLFGGELGFLVHDFYHWWVKSSLGSKEFEQFKSVIEYVRSLRSSQTDEVAVDQLGKEENGKENRMGKIIWNIADLDAIPNYTRETKLGWYLDRFFTNVAGYSPYLESFVEALGKDERNQVKFGIYRDDLDDEQQEWFDEAAELQEVE